MKKIFASVCTGMVALMVSAQSPIIVDLWPDGAPNDNGLSGAEEQLEGGRIANVSKPTLTVYPAKKGNGQAIIACPGGAYVRLAFKHEGTDMADWFNTQGVTYAVLKYRMPNGHKDVPLSDIHQAIKIMREHAEEWHFDPHKLGVMGSSAGGHVATTAATHYASPEERPDFQVLFYPVTVMDPYFGKVLFGNLPNPEAEIKEFSNNLHVTPDTPQAFIMVSADDRLVLKHALAYYDALHANKVPSALHIYPNGGHGWGYKDSFTYKTQWTGELEKWLREINK